MKFHVSPDGPGKCTAQPGNCPFGDESIHFATKAQANAAYEEKMAKSPGVPKQGKYPLTPQEKALRRQNFAAAQELVASRAATGEIIYDDANPVRAERRLKESIEYAKSRGNTHLVDKLSAATVLPSGAFKLADGRRVNTDAVLKTYGEVKAIEAARDEAIKKLTARLTDEPLGTKFSHKDKSGSYSLTVNEGIDTEAFDALPEEVRLKITSEREAFDIELAREKLTTDEYESITNPVQVIDYVVGKAPKNAVPKLSLRDSKSIQDGLEDVASFYGETHEAVGKMRNLKSTLSDGSDAIKASAAEREGNTFAPARSQFNGAVVNTRRAIDGKRAEELLSPQVIASLKKKVVSPDPLKAAAVLSPEEFGKIFKARKLSLRVTEAKD